MRRLITLLILGFALQFASVASAGALRTRDGRVFEGDLSVEAGGSVKVTPKGAGAFALTFPMSDVLSMNFRPAMVGVPSGGSLPGEWGVQDIGATGVSGSAEYSQGEFTLRGEGAQFGSATDDLHFVYRRLPSDGQLIARVQSLGAKDSDLPDLHPLAKAGLMIRKTLDPASCYYGILLTADDGPKAFVRPNSDSPAVITPIISPVKIKPPYWLRVTRAHDQVSTAISADGKRWELIAKQAMPVLSEAYIGMFVSSNRGDQLATAIFDHVRATVHGLRAEYFADTQFKDLRMTRIDPAVNYNWTGRGPDVAGVAEGNFSVRWTGQVAAPTTDAYQFTFAADAAARLYINGQMVVDTRSRVPRSGVVNLVMDKRYDLRVDYYAGAVNPTCRLFWTCSTQPEQQIVPTEQLTYAPEADRAAPADVAAAPAPAIAARGVLLVDGSFLPGSVKSADEENIHFIYRDRKELSIPRARVAWMVFRPLSAEAVAKIPANGAGLLTLADDFVEGDCQEITGGKAKVSSVVFGVSSFELSNQIAAIALQSAGSSTAPWLLRTSSGGTLRATGFHIDEQKLIVEEPILGNFELRLGELVELSATR